LCRNRSRVKKCVPFGSRFSPLFAG
jgi:hypothetical protein